MNPSIEATPLSFLRLQRNLRVVVIMSAAIVMSFAIIVLTGYVIKSLPLIRFPLSATGMNPTVALNFLLAGIMLFVISVRPDHPATILCCKIVAGFLIIGGIARFSELSGIYDPTLDVLLFPNWFPRTPNGVILGRMSYTTAFLFILTGIAFWLRSTGKRKVNQFLLFAIIIFSLFTLLSILYGVSNTYFGPLLVLKMALSSSICFFLVAFSFLIERPGQGIMSVITSRKAGGNTARLLLPVVLVFPLLGLVDRLTETSGLFQGALGLALFSLVAMALFMVIIIRTAKSNNSLYDQLEGEVEERKKAVEEAYKADLFASLIYDNIPNMVFVKDGETLLFKSMNKAGEELTGNRRENMIGKSDYDFFPEKEADLFKIKDREVFEINQPVISEEPITTAHGIRWLRTKKIGVRDEKGRPLYMIGISEDVTELREKQEQLNRHSAELEEKVIERTQELRKSEKRFYAIIQSAPDAMIIADDKETIQLVNTQTEKMFGFTRSELLGRPISFLIPPKVIAGRNAGDESGERELFGKAKDGQEIPVEISLSPIETSEGILISVAIRDITQRKKAEKILVENELMFRGLTQNVPGVIYQWIERFDGSYGFKYVSPKLKQYFRLAPEEMHLLPDYIHPDDKERWRLSIEEANATEKPWFFEGRIVYPDGEVKWWRGTSVMSMKNEEGRVYNGIMMDITEQKLIQEKILQNQKRYEAIFNSQYQFMGLMNPDGTMLEVNETALNFAGLQSADVIGKPFWECYWWAISEKVQQHLRQSVAKAATGEFIRYEADILGKGGIIATIDFSIKPVLDDFGKVILLIPEGRDITQRKLLEQKSREQEEQIRLFVKHTPAAVAMFDNQMRYMIASDRWYQDYGLTGKDIIGKSHYRVFPEMENMEEWKEIHQRCLQGAVEIREEDPFPRADGSMDWLRWEIHPWRTNNNRIGGIILFTEVITEKMKVRENLKLLNKQLMESNKELEQFAYVASHDLQEPLRMVSSFLQLLEKKYKTQLDDSAQQYIHFAVDGSERMKTLINDLLKFSRVGTAADEHVEVDCTKIVQNLIKIYEEKINENYASVSFTCLPVIKGNKTQIDQLFQNLIGNALKYRSKENPVITIGCEEEDNKLKFYVKDNGIGIEPKFYEKVFVIFQRLHGKNEYSGTGIGLAICKKIVERHGGKIWIESEPGKGTAFFFSLPKSSMIRFKN
jgi:PAS domain S-box-containing protein